MKRTLALATGTLLGALALAGCGGSSSSTPTSTTTSGAHTGESALAWLTSEVRPHNGTLNKDQAEVVAASAASAESDAASFFGRLKTACTQLRDDAQRAGDVPPAPTSSLEASWKGMVTETVAYADDCLTLARTQSNADLTRWDDSLKAMDSANSTLNAAVAAVRKSSGGTGSGGAAG